MSEFKRIKKIADELNTSISKMSTDEKRKLMAECKRLTTTNCWFLMYELKDIVYEQAKAFLTGKKANKNAN